MYLTMVHNSQNNSMKPQFCLAGLTVGKNTNMIFQFNTVRFTTFSHEMCSIVRFFFFMHVLQSCVSCLYLAKKWHVIENALTKQVLTYPSCWCTINRSSIASSNTDFGFSVQYIKRKAQFIFWLIVFDFKIILFPAHFFVPRIYEFACVYTFS